MQMMLRFLAVATVFLQFCYPAASAHCTMTDDACEFTLVIRPWLTMRHITGQKVFISDTDGKLYILGSNATVPEHEVVIADGSPEGRVIHTVNGMWPGPTLTMYVNQNITIHVSNQLVSEAFTVHWHGLEVRGTPWMDGSGFVTQCPILPRQTFTYNFMSGIKGTYLYHTHSAGLLSMGAHGAMVIKERKADEMEDRVLIVQDYHNVNTHTDNMADALLGQFEPNGVPFEGYPTIDKAFTTALKLTSSLINGRGRVYDDSSVSVTKTPFPVFHVQKGKRYRFRGINAATGHQYALAIDKHELDIIATDGHDIESTVVNKFIFHSGERYDFVIDAKEEVGNYWIRVQTLIAQKPFQAYAILRYEGADIAEPTSVPRVCSDASPCRIVGCSTATFPGHTCIRVDELRSDGSDPAPIAYSGNFREFFVNFGLAITSVGVRGVVNGIQYSHPPVSAMTQPRELTTLCSEQDGCGAEKVCNCIKSIDLQFGDVVQFNILNQGFLSILHHPIHLHGYSFHVLKTGVRRTNAQNDDLGNNLDIDCGGLSNRQLSLCNNASWTDPSWAGGNVPGIEPARAPRKDTLTIPAGGYAVIRFVADNPGLWFFHCHLDTHTSIGKFINPFACYGTSYAHRWHGYSSGLSTNHTLPSFH